MDDEKASQVASDDGPEFDAGMHFVDDFDSSSCCFWNDKKDDETFFHKLITTMLHNLSFDKHKLLFKTLKHQCREDACNDEKGVVKVHKCLGGNGI